MKECNYPKCTECTMPDCKMTHQDIWTLLKRRRWAFDPELYRQKQRDYRSRVKSYLPHCDECEFCVLVRKEKEEGYRRLCIEEMRLIEQKISNSPQWCKRRKGKNEQIEERIQA